MTALRIEQPRLGFLVDRESDGDLMTALYEHDAVDVGVRVPFHLWTSDSRGRWWGQSTLFADDPDRSKYSYSPPRELDFYDSKGTVALIGCTSGPSTQRFGTGSTDAGLGQIRASFAIEGARSAKNYIKLNGLRSEIDGLPYWLGYSALKSKFTVNKDGSNGAITTTAASVDDMVLGRYLNMRAVAKATSSGQQTHEIFFRSQAFLQTSSKPPREWADHLDLHVSLRNLLRIAAWKPLNFLSHEAASHKEASTLSEKARQPWYPVRTTRTSMSDPVWKVNDQFLFHHAEIGNAGINRWRRLWSEYSRGLDPFVRLLDLEGATVDAHVMQLGVAVEALGYRAMIELGRTQKEANASSVEARLDLLLKQTNGVLPSSPASLPRDFAVSYNSVKHANRTPVDPRLKRTNYDQGVQLIRAWIALRLGAKKTLLRHRW